MTIKKEAANPVRRQLIQSAAALALGGLWMPSVRAASRSTFRIGFVSPQSGPLAMFSEPDQFVMEQVKRSIGTGIRIDGNLYPVEIFYKDSESNPQRAAEAARELIVNDQVDLVLASATPATTNPVADECEHLGVPCLTNDTPWQGHFFGRGGDPAKGFRWTYHFCWGIEDVVQSWSNLWQQIDSNRRIGVLWPDDADGNVWADGKLGFPPVLQKAGFQIVDPGRFRSDADFAGMVDLFKRQEVDIITGVVPPPDFQRFWKLAREQKLDPRIVTVGKASEFPAALLPFRAGANGLSVEVWWSPAHPFISGLTGQRSADLAREYMDTTGRNWTMPLGFKHALFEVAIDALRRSQGPGQLDSIRDAIAKTRYQSVVGAVDFSTGPVPNVSKTPLVCGQWEYRYRNLELLIVENSLEPTIPLQARLRPMRVLPRSNA
ncbi:ABC transporter substrate-binding protein [Parathalassolituus penaei]|uniref:ABC transporter substrate-binding protein n=1 Tax=Parathalassolituus penaei TaxID=2997323 RepID=A0A9X3EF14_9GAMM|nr:ABC transporter substrate-binding protein [Parathalassolituus penaei]MCY0966342.1 ABC transporter substrate-binding protein [Parathalassolituus penaei]